MYVSRLLAGLLVGSLFSGLFVGSRLSDSPRVAGLRVGSLFSGLFVGSRLSDSPRVAGLLVGSLFSELLVGSRSSDSSCVNSRARGDRVGKEVREAGIEGTKIGESVGPALGRGVCPVVGLQVCIGVFSRSASFVLIAATAARSRNHRGVACFMVRDCCCDVSL